MRPSEVCPQPKIFSLPAWVEMSYLSHHWTKEWLLGWFETGVPFERLRRQDVCEWLSWACFSSTWNQLVPAARERVEIVLEQFPDYPRMREEILKKAIMSVRSTPNN